jgi:DNA ligase-1
MGKFKPMLAAKVDDTGLATLPYPMWGSAKLDGVRANIHRVDTKPIVMSRSMTPFPNKRLQLQFGREDFMGYDGELCVGNPTDKNLCDNTRAETSTIHGNCTADFYVFDRWDLDMPYHQRQSRIYPDANLRVHYLPQVVLANADDVLAYEDEQVRAGYEGIILRRPDSPYKQNRSTLKEAYLLKVKRYCDAEAVVIGFEELMHNANEATESNTGHTKRATFQENLVPMDTLGALIVRGINGPFKDVTFNIGTGFTAAQRKALWLNREKALNKIVTYKYFPIGVKDKPRHPVFKCFRDPRDM